MAVVGHGLGSLEIGHCERTPVPAGFSFRKTDKHWRSTAKLSKWDVDNIRLWVRREGYGLPVKTQAETLRATEYPSIHVRTLVDVITNRSWFDPQYDPLMPADLPTNLPPAWLGWWISMLLMWRMLCSTPSGNESSAVATTQSS